MTATDAGGRIPEWTLGDRLRKAREATGLTTREFADEIGVSQKTISDAENDRRAVRKITLMAYAMRTGVDITWLEHGHPSAPGNGPGGALTRPYPPLLTAV